MATSNSRHRDWLEADDSYLPTNQLPLLRSMLGHRLSDLQRFTRRSPGEWVGESHAITARQDFFRKIDGLLMLEMDGLLPIYLRGSYYYALDFDEYSIVVTSESLGKGIISGAAGYQRYTLNEREYVDDRLYGLIGQRIERMRILIRAVEHHQDTPRALQDGLEMSFDNGTTVILSYMLGEAGAATLQLLFPEEIRWQAVQYKVDVVEGRLPRLYRFRRWWWRALDRAGRRLERP